MTGHVRSAKLDALPHNTPFQKLPLFQSELEIFLTLNAKSQSVRPHDVALFTAETASEHAHEIMKKNLKYVKEYYLKFSNNFTLSITFFRRMNLALHSSRSQNEVKQKKNIHSFAFVAFRQKQRRFEYTLSFSQNIGNKNWIIGSKILLIHGLASKTVYVNTSKSLSSRSFQTIRISLRNLSRSTNLRRDIYCAVSILTQITENMFSHTMTIAIKSIKNIIPHLMKDIDPTPKYPTLNINTNCIHYYADISFESNADHSSQLRQILFLVNKSNKS